MMIPLEQKTDIANITVGMLAGLAVFFAPLWAYFQALLIIMAVDIATKLMVVVKKKGWAGIKSSKLFRTIPKFIIYCLGIIAANGIQSIEPSIPVVKAVAYFIAVVEFKSVSENISEYAGINIFKAVKDMLTRSAKDDVNEDKQN